MKTTLAQLFLEELQEEAKATRALLALVPLDKGDYKLHEKSMKLMSLTTHVAEIPGCFHDIIQKEELDFAKMEYKPFIPLDTTDLLALFDKKYNEAIAILSNTADEKFDE